MIQDLRASVCVRSFDENIPRKKCLLDPKQLCMYIAPDPLGPDFLTVKILDDFYRIPRSQCYMMLTHQMIGDKATSDRTAIEGQYITKGRKILPKATHLSMSVQESSATITPIIKLECLSDEDVVVSNEPPKRKKTRQDGQKRERVSKKSHTSTMNKSKVKRAQDASENDPDQWVSEDLENIPLDERETRGKEEIVAKNLEDEERDEEMAKVVAIETLETTKQSVKIARVIRDTKEKTKSGKKPERVNFECEPCGYKFSRKWKYERHMNSHDRKKAEPKIFECVPCSRKFSQPSAYKQHMLKHSSEKPHKCDVCDKAFKRAYELKMHREIHTGSMYTCDICSFTTAYKVSLMVHKQRVHDKNYRHKCDQCEKAFMSKHELEDHRTRHLGTKSFICEICGNGFLQRSYLIHHKRVVHGVQNRAPMKLKCELCDKTFATKYCLQNHIGLHSQKFLCSQCGKEFASNYSLRMHNRMHTGERPHKCDTCNKSFARSNALSVHKLTHAGLRPYVCDLCDKSFTQRTTMMAHRRKHPGSHPPPPPTSLVELEKAADSNS